MPERVSTDPKDHLLDLLVSDERTAAEAQRLIDTLEPGAVAAARQGERINSVIAAKLSDIDKVKGELDQALRTVNVRNHVDGERRRMLADPFAQEHGITAADLPAIEKHMKEDRIADHVSAMKFYVNARLVGQPRAEHEYEPGIQFPHKGMGDYFKGTADGRGITDGPSPRDMGTQWARDRANKDLQAIRAGRPLEPAPFPVPEVDTRGFIAGAAR